MQSREETTQTGPTAVLKFRWAAGFWGKDEQPEIAGGEQLTEEDPESGFPVVPSELQLALAVFAGQIGIFD